MCTVTFIARRNGYALGMNRDEKLTRAAGLPPRLTHLNGRTILAPSDPSGGSWIGVNDTGATLALINWYSITSHVGGQPVSRGEVVRLALPSDSSAGVDAALAELPLAHVNPFRLIGVFPTWMAASSGVGTSSTSIAGNTAGAPIPGFPPASTNPAPNKRAAKLLLKPFGKLPLEARIGCAGCTVRTVQRTAPTQPVCTAKTLRRSVTPKSPHRARWRHCVTLPARCVALRRCPPSVCISLADAMSLG